ncbi:Tyramine beta-hydroxylase [Seminavis robusta]|uniref:Tyramine beta-hydroxylase n=1 Tax=Seminavis robusta TaxID=568900 RepID=A0A9N8E1Z9_9STRA|nr:Tyramine beta-hydroxylase [Seminavis robusta]|eukprot:Sro571_g168680.1 Tyramine beta-hydroxylase (620) ;mRNA; f:28727-30586
MSCRLGNAASCLLPSWNVSGVWFLVLAGVSLAAVPTVLGLPSFRDAIPNGYRVPNPEPQGGVWAGVGHANAGGGSFPLNPFGRDFLAAGSTWTAELCQQDSDGDGRSNGQELGDPNCTWQQAGQEEEPEGPALSHPGLADQVQDGGLLDSCDDYYEPPNDALELRIQFSLPNVLNGTTNRTTYMCEQVQLSTPPVDGVLDYSLIRSHVFDNHPNLLHHLVLYECDNSGVSSDGNKVGDGPYVCSGMESRCSILTGWALGRLPTCEPPNVGLAFNYYTTTTTTTTDGTNTNKKVLKLEAHYDNALRLSNAMDQSGMTLTVTPTLRTHESGLVRFGLGLPDANFDLPPAESSSELVSVEGTCPGQVTMQLPHPIFAYAWFPHMHYIGQSMITEHYRCGVKIGTLGNIQRYEFDNQQLYSFPEVIKILPGDVLHTTCSYNTSSTTTTTKGGTETSDEMCYNFIYYYPNLRNSLSGVENFFATCFAFDRGIRENWLPLMFGAIPNHTTRFATMNDGIGGWAVELNYTSDPTVVVNPCCGDNNDDCEQLYLSSDGGPCAVNDDCTSGLICHQAVCVSEDQPLESAPSESDSSAASPRPARTFQQWAMSSSMGLVLLLLRPWLLL